MSDASPAPGWYPDVERAGGERWWDGQAWTEYRRPVGGTAAPPQPPGQSFPSGQPGQPGQQFPPGQPGAPVFGQPAPAGYQAYGAAPSYPESSKAGWALGLSIFGLFCCGLTAIVGLILGRQEMKAIDEGRADPSNRGLAQAAFIVGIIALVLFAGVFLLGGIGAVVGDSA